MESNIPALDAKLRELFRHNLDCLTGTEHVNAGIYRKAGGDHMVIAACHPEAPLLLLWVSDTLLTQWNWKNRKTNILSAVARLNRDAVAGLHELHELPECIIYTYKQCVLVTSELTESGFCSLIERGIREFDAGLVILRG